MTGIDVHCVLCGYETVLFEGNYDEEFGEPCPNCGADQVAKLEELFESYPVPVFQRADGSSPGLVEVSPATRELEADLEEIFDIAADHGVIDS